MSKVVVTIEGADWGEVVLAMEQFVGAPANPMVSTPEEPPFLAEVPPYDPDRIVHAPAPVVPAQVAQAAPLCSTHGAAMVRWPAGVNKQGKKYNASWRCPVKDCPTKPIWDRDAA